MLRDPESERHADRLPAIHIFAGRRPMDAKHRDGQGRQPGLGYSASDSSTHPAIRYTGRLSTDTLNTMGIENSIIAGTGSQTTGLNRWGDYSSMAIDPVDDCTFWYANEYLASNGTFNWHTRLASFKFPSCQ